MLVSFYRKACMTIKKDDDMSKFCIGAIAAIFALSLSVGAIAAPVGKSGVKSGVKADTDMLEEEALDLAQNNGCFTCHAIDRKVIGPAWKDVAAKYRSDVKAEDRLVKKVSKGGKGVWGKSLAMPPFSPHMKEADIRILVKYVLSLK